MHGSNEVISGASRFDNEICIRGDIKGCAQRGFVAQLSLWVRVRCVCNATWNVWHSCTFMNVLGHDDVCDTSCRTSNCEHVFAKAPHAGFYPVMKASSCVLCMHQLDSCAWKSSLKKRPLLHVARWRFRCVALSDDAARPHFACVELTIQAFRFSQSLE